MGYFHKLVYNQCTLHFFSSFLLFLIRPTAMTVEEILMFAYQIFVGMYGNCLIYNFPNKFFVPAHCRCVSHPSRISKINSESVLLTQKWPQLVLIQYFGSVIIKFSCVLHLPVQQQSNYQAYSSFLVPI